MIKIYQISVLVLVIVLFSFCGQNNRATVVTPGTENNHKITVVEVIQSNSYTYIFVKEGFKEYWIATSIADVNEGDELFYVGGFEMNDFSSKELDRTFEAIVFVDQVSSEVITQNKQTNSVNKMGVKPHAKPDFKIELAENGISLAELFSDTEKYENTEVIVRGQVVKFNEAIMNKNWIHIQDGTEADGKFDLTITSLDKVNVDDIVTFKGVVFLNKDFGSGYTYEIIMEEAHIIE